jgi:dipeptidyl aminopeptidase/acylaminoacyl peptidase
VLIRCVVSFYGPSDLTTDFARSHPTVEGLLGASYATSPERFAHASPISHVSSDDPPTLIFHGTIDETVPVAQSDALAERLSDSGVAVEYHRLRGWPHTMDAVVPVNEYCQQVMDGFFSRHLAVDHLEPSSGR